MLPKRITTIYKAFANLYGAILSDDAYFILKKYYPDLKKSELTQSLKEKNRIKTLGYMVFKTEKNNKYVIANQYFDFERIGSVLSQTYIKQYYIYDNVDDFLKYSDSAYCEATKEYIMLYSYLQNSIHLDLAEINKWFNKVLFYNRTNIGDMQSIISVLNYKFDNQNQIFEFLKLYQNFINNLRIPDNLGHTPMELKD